MATSRVPTAAANTSDTFSTSGSAPQPRGCGRQMRKDCSDESRGDGRLVVGRQHWVPTTELTPVRCQRFVFVAQKINHGQVARCLDVDRDCESGDERRECHPCGRWPRAGNFVAVFGEYHHASFGQWARISGTRSRPSPSGSSGSMTIPSKPSAEKPLAKAWWRAWAREPASSTKAPSISRLKRAKSSHRRVGVDHQYLSHGYPGEIRRATRGK